MHRHPGTVAVRNALAVRRNRGSRHLATSRLRGDPDEGTKCCRRSLRGIICPNVHPAANPIRDQGHQQSKTAKPKDGKPRSIPGKESGSRRC